MKASTSLHFVHYQPVGGAVLGVRNLITMNNNNKIPQLGFGTYRVPPQDAGPAVSYALDCGFRHIDCAKAYCNQKEVGAAVDAFLRSRTVSREDVFMTSKLWPTDQHPDHVEAACRETLAELRLDYLDLFLIHWPVCWRHSPRFESDADKYPCDADGLAAVDSSVTLLDTWRAMSKLVDKGLVRSIGISNCSAQQVRDVVSSSDALSLHHPVVNQIELHPGWVDDEAVTENGNNNIVTAAYCPLGMPTRSTPPGYKPLTEYESIQYTASVTGFTPQRLLLNWNLDLNNVVIVKSTNKQHIKSNAKAARFALSAPARRTLGGFRFVVCKTKVVNPDNFTKSGKPFFS